MVDKIKKIGKYFLELLLFVILYRSFEIAGIKKYAAAILICGVFLILARKKEWPVQVLAVGIPAAVYLTAGGLMGMIHGTYQLDSVKIMMYGILSFALALAFYAYYGKDLKKIVNIQFFACCIVYLSLTIVYMVTRLSRVESTFAFVFGVFAVYYAYEKRWKLFAAAMLFMYLADKRIVLLGVAASLFILGVLWLFRYHRKLAYTIWGMVTAFVFLYLFLIYSGTMENFCWGANINTNGRVEMYGRMAQEFSTGLLGEGLGVVENLLGFWNIEVFANLHNDLLKLHIELGFLGMFAYLGSYFLMFYFVEKKFGASKMCFLLVISVYTMILYATDNVSIYVMYLLPMYSVIFAALSGGKTVEAEVKGIKQDEKNNQ